jgi:hypothetical protein
MHTQVLCFFCLISCLFHKKKIFSIFKVVGMLCKSNDYIPPKNAFYFHLVSQQNRRNVKGVNTFASHCSSSQQNMQLGCRHASFLLNSDEKFGGAPIRLGEAKKSLK